MRQNKRFLDWFPLTRTTLTRDGDAAPGFVIAYMHQRRIRPQRLVVLLPAALRPATEAGKEVFFRWTWRESWPRDDVMAFIDPVVHKYHRECGITGAWFAHPEVDFLQLVAEIVTKTAAERGIDVNNIVYYGSSLGGFAAISAAALTPGAHAVAEIPQIALRDWRPRPIRLLEQNVFGMPLSEFEQLYPERVDLKARCEQIDNIPSLTILTNADEPLRPSQEAFVQWARTHAPKREIRMVVRDGVSGHAVAPREDVIPWI